MTPIAFGTWLAATTMGLAASPTDYQGRFTTTEEAIQPVVDKAVEDGASQFNALIRGIARGRLRKSLQASPWVEFAIDGEEMTIRTEQRPKGVTTRYDGTAASITEKNGKPAKVRRWMADGALRAEACNSEGDCLDYTFQLAGDELVITRVTRSSQLTTPITYQLTYRRQ